MSKERDERPKQEIERRMENAIQRALKTPPKPHKEIAGKGKSKDKQKKGASKAEAR